jgi:hypothetical protein
MELCLLVEPLHNNRSVSQNIETDLERDIGWSGMDRIHLVVDRVQWKALMNMAINH